MAKNKTKPAAPAAGGMSGLMDKLNQMQSEMKRVQEELAEERYTISVGGDAVQVVIDGQQRVHHVIFSPEALAAGQQDREMLQDLVVAAVNNALEHSQMLAAERLQALSGGLGLPELPD
jgi:DNA-binding YbaB/EbfC family protein